MATQKKFVVKNGLIASDLSYPTSDGTANQPLVTDGAGNLSFGTAGTAETLTFTGKNTTGSTIAKGTVVYVSDLSGNTPEISLARANSSSTMPAFGLVTADIGNNNNGAIDTFGSLRGLNIANFGETGITFALGDTLYVSAAEAGKLTNVPPAGEANLIQNIGKIERATPTTNMTIKVGGAGRTNATSALNDGNIFIGNSSNQSSTAALNTSIVPEGSNLYYTDARADARAALIVDAAPSTLDTLNELAAALGDDANFSTTVTNSIATKLPLAGGTITGEVSFTDGNKAVFGTGSDLQIYHTGGTSVINDVGTGRLFIGGSPGVDIGTPEIDEYYIRAYNDGAVELYYDNAKKLETTTTGIDVTGTVRADDLTIGHTSNFSNALANDIQVGTVTGSHGISILSQNNSYSSLFFADNDNNDAGSIRYNHSNNTIDFYTDRAQRVAINSTGIDVTGNLTVDGDVTFFKNTGGSSTYDFVSDHYTEIALTADYDGSHGGPHITSLIANGSTGSLAMRTNNVNRLQVAQNGDVNFYNSAGNVASFFWDASTERLGIGTDAPATALHVRGTASTVGATRSVVTLTDDTAMGINVGSGVAFRGLYTSAGLEANYGGIFAGKSNANSGNANGYLSLSYSASGTLTEGIRISETGNVGIGTSSPDAILDIEGNFETNYALKFTNTQGTGKVGGFRSHGTNGNDLTIYQDGARKQGWSSSEVKFYGTSNAEVMRIENGGNVLIGSNTNTNTGLLQVDGAISAKVHHELFTVGTIASNIVSLDLNTGTSVVTVASPGANFSLAITNVPNTGNTTTGIAAIVTQGGSPFIPNALTVNGSAVTINWLGGSAPAGTASKTEIFSFTVINTGGVFTALGSVSTFG